MGQEFGQWNEWSEERELDWYLLDDESHKQMKDFTKKCMLLYKNTDVFMRLITDMRHQMD